jgi:hypothetical protein
MSAAMPHIEWFHKTAETFQTSDGKSVEVWELRHLPEEKILSQWSKHFRNHYCLDEEIDELRDGTNLSRAEYLEQLVFPDEALAPGPSIRSGDFAEIIMADLIEYVWGYWVPRFRYDEKAIRNESTKGADILGFKLTGKQHSPKDTLIICEAKAALTSPAANNRLQQAIDDSAKDMLRRAHSLNALKRRLIRKNDTKSEIVKRFQDPIDNPYTEISGAAAILADSNYDMAILNQSNATEHPNKSGLILIVLKGADLMALTNSIYLRAANEA